MALGALVLGTALALFNPPLASAQSGRFLEISGELSPVTNGTLDTTWRAARAAGGVQEEGRFGWTLSGERHQRREAVDWAYQAGGFRRAGDWTLSGSLGFGINPTFLYRHSFEGELARRAIGGLVVHGGYRHLVSREATVHVVLPAMSWYFRRGEFQARGYLVRNVTTNRRASTVLLRGSVAASSRVRVSAGVAVGSRIFDVVALSAGDADAWLAFGAVRFLLTPGLSIDAGVGAAHEDPLFSQRTVSLGARWSF